MQRVEIENSRTAGFLTFLSRIPVLVFWADAFGQCIRKTGKKTMAKFDGVIGQSLMTIEKKDDEVVFVFQDNRFLFVNAVNGTLQVTSVPE